MKLRCTRRVAPHLVMLMASFSLFLGCSDGPELPSVGCPMAHCDSQMSDRVGLQPPTGEVAELWRREGYPSEKLGSAIGLGCSSNGEFAACSYRASERTVVVYDYDGRRLWDSGDLLGEGSFGCVPLITSDNSVIACDAFGVVRFDADGEVVWSQDFSYPAFPLNPVVTANRTVVIPTMDGPIYAVDYDSGAPVAAEFVREFEDDPGFYHTRNTAAVSGNRVYVVMEHSLDASQGRLVALDVRRPLPFVGGSLEEAWSFPFGGPSGASPLLIDDVIYFDADRADWGGPLAPRILAVRDRGSWAEELLEVPVWETIRVSFSKDPRGGFWLFSGNDTSIVRRDHETGDVLQEIDLDWLLADEPGVFDPASVLTMAGDAERPIMLVFARCGGCQPNFLVAVDLVDESLIWRFPISGDIASGQFPILEGHAGPRVVFTTYLGGARAVGLP